MSEQTMESGNEFGIPEAAKPDFLASAVAPAVESEADRALRLRAQADAMVRKETDDEMLHRFLLEARAKRDGVELPPDETVFPLDTQGFPKEYDWIEIYEGQGEHEIAYVPLSINGFCIKAPRGVPICIPHIFVTECLDHAIGEREVKRQGGLVTRPVHRFPYRMVGKATTEEYQAYIAGQRELASRQLAAVVVQ